MRRNEASTPSPEREQHTEADEQTRRTLGSRAVNILHSMCRIRRETSSPRVLDTPISLGAQILYQEFRRRHSPPEDTPLLKKSHDVRERNMSRSILAQHVEITGDIVKFRSEGQKRRVKLSNLSKEEPKDQPYVIFPAGDTFTKNYFVPLQLTHLIVPVMWRKDTRTTSYGRSGTGRFTTI